MGTAIMGNSVASADQMQAYIKKINHNVPQSVIDMIPLYLSEGAAEGVRGDVAFAQSCLETGNFSFSGSAVTLEQNNFAGIGVTSRGMRGNSWATPQLGIRAQVQHLKAYASTEPLNQECVDDRFRWVQRGSAPYVEWLGIQENPQRKGWAAGKDYGKKILDILSRIVVEEKQNNQEGKAMRINVHAGHNSLAPGAYGIFSETKEDRIVKDRVIAKLKAAGHIVYDCTDEVGKTASENLANIVAKCNAHKVDLDVSIHFNAFNGSANGVEVLCYDGGTHAVAGKILSAIAKRGFHNRGIKNGSWLYVLANTNDPALLVECCFCDSRHDADLYRAEQIADAIVEGITGRVVAAAQWIKNGVGWWYRHADGSYTKDGWEQINGKWYYFDGNGYMIENQWIKYKERWYWADQGGAMQTGWVNPGPFWYFLDSTGAMQTGWVQYSGKWYYLNPVQKDGLPEGAMMTGPVEVKGILYNLGNDGALEWEVNLKGGVLKAVAEKKWEIERPGKEQPEEKDK